jgi:hypothetical protein
MGTGSLIDIDLFALIELEDKWDKACQHRQHHHGGASHSDDVAVIEVAGRALPCCGFTSVARYLCAAFIKSNSELRCVECGAENIPFEDCYTIIGQA